MIRGLGLIARSPAVLKEATERVDRFLAGDGAAIDANLQDAASGDGRPAPGDAARFDPAPGGASEEEKDPAFKRRYLLGLAAFEKPELAKRAHELALSDTVPMQDFAIFAGALFANRVGRDGFWTLVQARWKDVAARAGTAPMLFRRVIEAFGQLPERRHCDEVSRFLEANPVDSAKQAFAQTLVRMRQDAELRERGLGAVSTWLRAH